MKITFDMLHDEAQEELVEEFASCLDFDLDFFKEHIDKTQWLEFCKKLFGNDSLNTCELSIVKKRITRGERWLREEYRDWCKSRPCCNAYDCPCH